VPYTSHAPPVVLVGEDPHDVYVGSRISGKPVTAVTAVTAILDMSLTQFAAAGRAVEVRVPWLDETIWWVSGMEQLKTLLDRGVSRGRVLTAGELVDLAKVARTHPDDVVRLMRVKLAFGATLESVEPLELHEGDAAPSKKSSR
jgi:hypothetical protein